MELLYLAMLLRSWRNWPEGRRKCME